MKNDELAILKYHEAGHAVVAVRLGFRVKRLALAGGHQPAGGVPLPALDAKELSPDLPTADRQTLVIPVIAVCAAGCVAEEKQFKSRRDDWCESDRGLMIRYAVQAVVGPQDAGPPEKDRPRDDGWARWPEVDEVVRAGENLAKSVLGNDWKAVQRVVGQLRTERAVVFGPVLEKLVKQDDGGR